MTVCYKHALEDTLQATEKMLKHSAVDIADLSDAWAYLNGHSEDSLLISSFLSLESGQKLFADAMARVNNQQSDDTLKEQLLDVEKALEQQLGATKDQDVEAMTLDAFKLQSEQLVCAGLQCTQAFGRVVGEKMKADLMPRAKAIFDSFVLRAKLILPVAQKKVLAWVDEIKEHESKLFAAVAGDTLDAALLACKTWKDTISLWIQLWRRLANTEEALSTLVGEDDPEMIETFRKFRTGVKVWDHVVTAVDAYLQNKAHMYLWEDGEDGSDQRLQSYARAMVMFSRGVKAHSDAQELLSEHEDDHFTDIKALFGETGRVSLFFLTTAEDKFDDVYTKFNASLLCMRWAEDDRDKFLPSGWSRLSSQALVEMTNIQVVYGVEAAALAQGLGKQDKVTEIDWKMHSDRAQRAAFALTIASGELTPAADMTSAEAIKPDEKFYAAFKDFSDRVYALQQMYRGRASNTEAQTELVTQAQSCVEASTLEVCDRSGAVVAAATAWLSGKIPGGHGKKWMTWCIDDPGPHTDRIIELTENQDVVNIGRSAQVFENFVIKVSDFHTSSAVPVLVLWRKQQEGIIKVREGTEQKEQPGCLKLASQVAAEARLLLACAAGLKLIYVRSKEKDFNKGDKKKKAVSKLKTLIAGVKVEKEFCCVCV